MKKKERVAIFIDGSNFYHSVRDTFHVHDNRVDFSKLMDVLTGKRELISAYYYNASLDRGYNENVYWKQQRFFSELRKISRFRVVLCRMRKIKDGKKVRYQVKGDDIQMAVDMVSMAYEDKYDTGVVVSGDGDFVPAIRKAQKLGKKVENAYFTISSSEHLKRVCSKSMHMDGIVKKCIRK